MTAMMALGIRIRLWLCTARVQVVQNEPVRYPEDVPISDALRHMLGAMLTKVRV